jgi:hypothetical protein
LKKSISGGSTQIREHADDRKEYRCPNSCQNEKMCKDGGYERKLVNYEQGKVVTYSIQIACVKCSECRHSHALLPADVVPYTSFNIRFMICVVRDYLVHKFQTVEALCQNYDISISTFYRLLHRYMEDNEKMIALLENLWESIKASETQEVCVSLYMQYLGKFYRKYGYSFLQPRYTGKKQE